MQPIESVLDVGCNAGARLKWCRARSPKARLAGVEINEKAILDAKAAVPDAEIHRAGGEAIPFPDNSFQYATCEEVLEHMPAELRAPAFREIWRVLRPGGRLILTTPHAGWFAWLDSNNIRFRIPRLYRWVVGQGGRDANYAAMGRQVEWHYHFSKRELEELAGDGWRWVAVHRGGLFVFPLMGILSWPFYRRNMHGHWILNFLNRVAGWDYKLDFGAASYGICIVLEKQSAASQQTTA